MEKKKGLKGLWDSVKEFHEEQQAATREKNPEIREMDSAILANIIRKQKEKQGLDPELAKQEARNEALEMQKNVPAIDPEDMIMGGTVAKKLPSWAKKLPLNPGARGQWASGALDSAIPVSTKTGPKDMAKEVIETAINKGEDTIAGAGDIDSKLFNKLKEFDVSEALSKDAAEMARRKKLPAPPKEYFRKLKDKLRMQEKLEKLPEGDSFFSKPVAGD